MKRLLFLLLILLTWYLAGMYRLRPIMVLALTELLVFLWAAVLPRILKRQLQLGFPNGCTPVTRGGRAKVGLQVKNRGRLPVSRFRLHFSSDGPWDHKKRQSVLTGCVDGKETKELELEVSADCCGLLTLAVKGAEVYDYLSLFWAKSACRAQTQIAVLPSARGMHLAFQNREPWQDSGSEREAVPLAGNSRDEVRQIREYAPGDSPRQIHWNQSARLDTLLVKEYGREESGQIPLVLDLFSVQKPERKRISAFYELFYALVLGLLEQQIHPVVLWQNAQGDWVQAPVVQEGNCRELIIRLCRQQEDAPAQRTAPGNWDGFYLGMDLRLTYRGRELAAFTPEGYEAELEQRIWVC